MRLNEREIFLIINEMCNKMLFLRKLIKRMLSNDRGDNIFTVRSNFFQSFEMLRVMVKGSEEVRGEKLI